MRVEARLERVGGEERETVGVDSFSTSLALKGRRIRVVAARSFVRIRRSVRTVASKREDAGGNVIKITRRGKVYLLIPSS